MPSSLVQGIATRCGYSQEKIETWWENAKQQVREQFDRSENDQDFWRLVTGIVKRQAGKECARKFGKEEGIEYGDPNRLPPSRASRAILSSLLGEMISDEYGIHLEGNSESSK